MDVSCIFQRLLRSSISIKIYSRSSLREKFYIFGVSLVCIFPHSDWIQKDTAISPYSVLMRENADLKNTEYGHFSRNVSFMAISSSFTTPLKHKLKVSVHLLCIFINNFTTLFKCNVSCFFLFNWEKRCNWLNPEKNYAKYSFFLRRRRFIDKTFLGPSFKGLFFQILILQFWQQYNSLI